MRNNLLKLNKYLNFVIFTTITLSTSLTLGLYVANAIDSEVSINVATLELISVADPESQGYQGDLDSYSFPITFNQLSTNNIMLDGITDPSLFPSSHVLSNDGQYVVFTSVASNLVEGDTNDLADVFVRDTHTNETKRISVDGSGEQIIPGNSQSAQSIAQLTRYFYNSSPAISPNGEFIAFQTYASLVGLDANPITSDIYLKKNLSYEADPSFIKRVSSGQTAGNSSLASVSNPNNGFIYVAFESTADLGGSETETDTDIFVRKINSSGSTGESTTRISRGTNGSTLIEANGESFVPSISAYGTRVTFHSLATNLVSNVIESDAEANSDVYLYVDSSDTDITVDDVTYLKLISHDTNGNPATLEGGSAVSKNAAIATNGDYIAFQSTADNLNTSIVLTDLNSKADIYRYNIATEEIDLVSCDNTSNITTANDSSDIPSISADGRYVAFRSNATNLMVSSNGDGSGNMYVRDMDASGCVIYRISSNVDDIPHGGTTYGGSIISDDNNLYAAFTSLSSGLLVENEDTNGRLDVFIKTRQLSNGASLDITRVSLANQAGDAAPSSTTPNGNNTEPRSSADSHYVAFTSLANNLVIGDTNNLADIFVRDTFTNTTIRVSDADNPDTPEIIENTNGSSESPSLSANGRYVTYSSIANNLVVPDSNDATDIFLYDINTNLSFLVSSNVMGDDSGAGGSTKPVISANGLTLAFLSTVSSDTWTGLADGNSGNDLFVRNLDNNHDGIVGDFSAYEVISINSEGIATANAASTTPTISTDGNIIAFTSRATDLVSNVSSSGFNNVYYRNRIMGTNTLVSINADNGNANFDSDNPKLSGDGCIVVFESLATNLLKTEHLPEINTFPTSKSQVYYRDMCAETPQTKLVSMAINIDGLTEFANDSSILPHIAEHGRFIAFTSQASNLLGYDNGGAPIDNNCTLPDQSGGCSVYKNDIFVYEIETNSITRVSTDAMGVVDELTSNAREQAFISAYGQYVIFESFAGVNTWQIDDPIEAKPPSSVTDKGLFMVQLQGPTAIALSSSADTTAAIGETIDFTVIVSATGIPTGSISFSTLESGQITGCQSITLTNAMATCSSALNKGQNSIVAHYNGDNTYLSSQSVPLLLNIVDGDSVFADGFEDNFVE